jgi:hypothetical protein
MNFVSALRIYLESGAELAIPRDSDFGVEQEIAPVSEAGAVEVDVNGNAVPLPATQHRKFTTSLSVGSVTGVPALADIWPASRLTIHSVAKLTQSVPPGGEVELIRSPVSGSVRCYNAAGAVVAHSRSGRTVTAAGASYVRYAPILEVVVTEYQWSAHETAAESSWSLSARES